MSEQFDEQGNSFDTDDVQGHRQAMDKAGWAADKAGDKAGLAPDEDTEARSMDKAAAADTAGDKAGLRTTTSRATCAIEVNDDVIGKAGLQVQPPRDADNQGNQF